MDVYEGRSHKHLQLMRALGLDEELETERHETIGSAFAFQPFLSQQRGNVSIIKHINDRRHILDLEFRSPHDIDISPDGSVLFVAELAKPYLSKINVIKSG